MRTRRIRLLSVLVGVILLLGGAAGAALVHFREAPAPPREEAPVTYDLRVTPPVVTRGGMVTVAVEASDPHLPLGVSGTFRHLRLRFYRQGGAHVALLPVDSTVPGGQHELVVTIRTPDWRVRAEVAVIEVLDREFPADYLRMPQARAALLTAQSLESDRAKIQAATAASSPVPLWQGAFMFPTAGRITSTYGLVRYVNGRIYGRHSGVDIANREGTPVVASNTGRVVLADRLIVTGNRVIIDHGLNLFSSYCHLSEILVEVGQGVAKGQIIGRMGDTGFSTGSHLHWGITVGDVAVDPLLFLSRRSKDP